MDKNNRVDLSKNSEALKKMNQTFWIISVVIVILMVALNFFGSESKAQIYMHQALLIVILSWVITISKIVQDIVKRIN